MKPINSIDNALKAIKAHRSSAEEFELPITDELQDPEGMNIAIITDGILKKGWKPNGFIQKNGYRIYLYKKLGTDTSGNHG